MPGKEAIMIIIPVRAAYLAADHVYSASGYSPEACEEAYDAALLAARSAGAGETIAEAIADEAGQGAEDADVTALG